MACEQRISAFFYYENTPKMGSKLFTNRIHGNEARSIQTKSSDPRYFPPPGSINQDKDDRKTQKEMAIYYDRPNPLN